MLVKCIGLPGPAPQWHYTFNGIFPMAWRTYPKYRSWRKHMVFPPALLIPTSFKIRNTSMVRSATPIRRSGGELWIIFSNAYVSLTLSGVGTSLLGLGVVRIIRAYIILVRGSAGLKKDYEKSMPIC